jgi:hypothetical protein
MDHRKACNLEILYATVYELERLKEIPAFFSLRFSPSNTLVLGNDLDV